MTGAGRWREADEWPLPIAESTPFYLSGDGTAAPAAARAPPAALPPAAGTPSGGLGPGAARRRSARPVRLRPARPAELVGGPRPVGGREAPRRPAAARGEAGRADVHRPGLAAPLEVVGPLGAVLWVSTTAPDTDFVVSLVDVWPDGYVQLVQQGIRGSLPRVGRGAGTRRSRRGLPYRGVPRRYRLPLHRRPPRAGRGRERRVRPLGPQPQHRSRLRRRRRHAHRGADGVPRPGAALARRPAGHRGRAADVDDRRAGRVAGRSVRAAGRDRPLWTRPPACRWASSSATAAASGPTPSCGRSSTPSSCTSSPTWWASAPPPRASS